MKFKREEYSERLVTEIMPLLKAHYEETADKFYGPFDPSIETYEMLSNGGNLRIFTVRHFDDVAGVSVLCGYQIFFISKHHHSKNLVQATQDILYLVPEFRKGFNGYKFVRWCSDQLKEEGVHVVHQIIPVKNGLGRMMAHMGYQIEDVIYSRSLQEVA